MIARHLCDIQMGLYASPEYLASIGGVDSPNDLSQFRRLSWFSGRERNPFMVGAGVRPGAFRGAVRRWNAVRRTRRGYFGLHGGQRHLPWRPIRGGWIRTRRETCSGTAAMALFCGAGACHLPGSRHLSVRVRCFVNWVMELFAENPEIQLTPIALALESGLAQRT
ncbi:hypothetical protein P4119_03675 [Pseudomonas aeruginosa]|nr:hypothetical protein [Pseudomonas aeruginosa]